MRWILAVAILLAGAGPRGEELPILPLVGRVVAIEDGGHLWIYVDQVRASYRINLTGVDPAPACSPAGRYAKEALSGMVLGREVTVKIPCLVNEGAIPGEVLLEGQSINCELASRLRRGLERSIEPPREVSSRRPLALLFPLLRVLPPWRDR